MAYRSYFTSTVLPKLNRQLVQAEATTSATPDREKKIDALKNSIGLANRFLATGHY